MPTFMFSGPWWEYALWNLASFTAAFFLLNSFIEHQIHSRVMHRLFWLVPYGYAHTTSHHARFGSDKSYTLDGPADERRTHILFTWREYVILPPVCLAAYAPVEWIAGKPILLGILLSAFAGLQMFNSLHWRFHAPSDTWFQRTSFFQFLARHHRIHHGDMTKNFNVYFLPLADMCLGTLDTKEPL